MITEETRKKMSLARMGVSPWNKGKKFKLMENNKHAFKGDRATKWAGHKRASKLLRLIKICMRCQKKKTSYQLVVHHINENPLDNNINNIEKICRSCHIAHHRDKLQDAKVKKYGNKFGKLKK